MIDEMRREFEAQNPILDRFIDDEGVYTSHITRLAWTYWSKATERAAMVCDSMSKNDRHSEWWTSRCAAEIRKGKPT